MTIYEIYKNAISLGNYNAEGMEGRIEEMYAEGKITSDERTELLQLANDEADDIAQIDVVAKLADLESRLVALETADIVEWTSGYTTQQGETVKYDYDGDGVLDLLRYDGGRSYTALSPGKIDGWHVVDSAGNILGTWYAGVFTAAEE